VALGHERHACVRRQARLRLSVLGPDARLMRRAQGAVAASIRGILRRRGGRGHRRDFRLRAGGGCSGRGRRGRGGRRRRAAVVATHASADGRAGRVRAGLLVVHGRWDRGDRNRGDGRLLLLGCLCPAHASIPAELGGRRPRRWRRLHRRSSFGLHIFVQACARVSIAMLWNRGAERWERRCCKAAPVSQVRVALCRATR
jgi:hypothetical protein